MLFLRCSGLVVYGGTANVNLSVSRCWPICRLPVRYWMFELDNPDVEGFKPQRYARFSSCILSLTGI